MCHPKAGHHAAPGDVEQMARLTLPYRQTVRPEGEPGGRNAVVIVLEGVLLPMGEAG